MCVSRSDIQSLLSSFEHDCSHPDTRQRIHNIHLQAVIYVLLHPLFAQERMVFRVANQRVDVVLMRFVQVVADKGQIVQPERLPPLSANMRSMI